MEEFEPCLMMLVLRVTSAKVYELNAHLQLHVSKSSIQAMKRMKRMKANVSCTKSCDY
jgi:hypothetical protein